MTRICEKFVEDLSAGLTDLTGEMQAHLLTCPDCQQALAAVKLLKQQRKPMTGKEALAIAAILKAVKIEAAAGAASAAAATQEASVLSKVVLAAVVAFAILFTGSSINKMQKNTQQPVSGIEETIPELKQEVASSTEVAVATEPQVFITHADPVEEQAASDSADPASAANLLTDQKLPVSNQEKENPEQPKTIMVSPDQEEVDPR